MSQQSDATKNLDELALCVDTLINQPTNRAVAQRIVECYLNDAAHETVSRHSTIRRTRREPSPRSESNQEEAAASSLPSSDNPASHQDASKPTFVTGLSLADLLPTDPNDSFDWTETSLDDTNVPLTQDQTAAALVAFHAVHCKGVEAVIADRTSQENLSAADERRAVCWSVILDRVERCGEYALDWFKLQFHRFEQILSEQTAPSASLPTEQQVARATKGKNIDARMLKAISKNHESLGWSAQQWASHLGCASSTVKETSTWKVQLKTMRAFLAADAAEGFDTSRTRSKGGRTSRQMPRSKE